MSEALEACYRKVLAGFSAEELARLPLAYTVYGDDLGALVRSLGEDKSPLQAVDLTYLYSLMAELAGNLQQQVDGAEFRHRFAAWDEQERKVFFEELAVLSDATYSKILAEYFFLLGVVELIAVVQQAFGELHEDSSFEHLEVVIENTKKRIIEVFQEIDGIYGSVQDWIASNSR